MPVSERLDFDASVRETGGGMHVNMTNGVIVVEWKEWGGSTARYRGVEGRINVFVVIPLYVGPIPQSRNRI